MDQIEVEIDYLYQDVLKDKYKDITFDQIQANEGLYVTNIENKSLKNDLRIFNETQIKRLLRKLNNRSIPIKKKLSYFSQDENNNKSNVYQYDAAKELTINEEYAIQNIGHATQLIQLSDFNILTDPIFADINYLLYPEKTCSYPNLENLPKIDVILISHNHRDHLDKYSLNKLLRYYKSRNWIEPKILVPQGDKGLLESFGFRFVIEVEWFTKILITKNATIVDFISIPVDHRSGRGTSDHHKSLVNGWIINPISKNVIFKYSGDTRPLTDTNQKAIDTIIWYEIMNKNMYRLKQLSDIQIPDLICFEPSGPNYTRSDMNITHQSTSYSILLKFAQAQNLSEISGIHFENIISKIRTIMMHHNKFELGPDRFNEGLFIAKKLLQYLNISKEELTNELKKQEKKLQENLDQETIKSFFPITFKFIFALLPHQSSILVHSKEFIIKEIFYFINKLEESAQINNIQKYLSKYLISNTVFPKIGERLNNEQIRMSKLTTDEIKKYEKKSRMEIDD